VERVGETLGIELKERVLVLVEVTESVMELLHSILSLTERTVELDTVTVGEACVVFVGVSDRVSLDGVNASVGVCCSVGVMVCVEDSDRIRPTYGAAEGINQICSPSYTAPINFIASSPLSIVGVAHTDTNQIRCVSTSNTATFLYWNGASQIRVPSNVPPANSTPLLLKPGGHASNTAIDALDAVIRTKPEASLGYSQWYGLLYAIPRNPSFAKPNVGSPKADSEPDDSVTRSTCLPFDGDRYRYVPS